MKSQLRSHRRRAAGIALPIVLMFLLVITVAAGFGIRRAILGEGVARNQLDYEVARNAAEAALRDGERDLFMLSKAASAKCDRMENRPLGDAIKPPYWGSTCPNGQCYVTAEYLATSVFSSGTNPMPWWPDANNGRWGNNATSAATCSFTGGVPIGTYTGSPQISGVARQPEYLIEYIARVDDPVIRVTARGFGADVNTEVVLQTYIRAALD
jgi:type IV pilus assembly protein PilX